MQEDNDTAGIHNSLSVLIEKLLVEDHQEPLLVAACMLVQALSMYRTILSPEEYSMMTKHILGHRDDIKTMTTATSTLH